MKELITPVILLICSLFSAFAQTVHTLDFDSDNIYEVQPGDSLSEVAKKFDTTEEELIQANGLQSTALLAGQKLKVPFLYEVQMKDTIGRVAERYGSTAELIKNANKLSSPLLQPGMIIKIPPKKLAMQGTHILMTKEEFKEWLFNSKISRKIAIIQHHHTWRPSYAHFKGNNHFQLLNSMEHFHKSKMGWKTIAQNITTFPDGKIAVSRPFNMTPEGSIGAIANAEGITIENVGNFNAGNDVMTKEQKDAIIYVTALLCLKFNLIPSVDSITYHHWWRYKTGERVLDNAKDYEVKSCPGTAFFGGNCTKSAQKYFYPLVVQKMNEIKKQLHHQPFPE